MILIGYKNYKLDFFTDILQNKFLRLFYYCGAWVMTPKTENKIVCRNEVPTGCKADTLSYQNISETIKDHHVETISDGLNKLSNRKSKKSNNKAKCVPNQETLIDI